MYIIFIIHSQNWNSNDYSNVLTTYYVSDTVI